MLTRDYTEIIGHWHQAETSTDMSEDIYNKVAKLESQLSECLDAIQHYWKKRGIGDHLKAESWFLSLLKRHGRVKPVEGEDLSKFRRPE